MLKCVTILLSTHCYVPDARIIHVEPAISVEDVAREQRWIETCKPEVYADREGINRYRYSTACPHGVIVGK